MFHEEARDVQDASWCLLIFKLLNETRKAQFVTLIDFATNPQNFYLLWKFTGDVTLDAARTPAALFFLGQDVRFNQKKLN